MAVNGAKPSVSEEAIRYQARTTLATLATEIAGLRKHKSEKALEKIKEAKQIRLWLKALDYKAYLTRAQREKIWYALIDIANVNDFPTAPLLEERTVPNVLIGGGTTTTNVITQSESAGNISFSNSDVDTGTEVVDSFAVSLSSGVKWKYTARKNDGSSQKSGEVIATWLSDGSDVDWAEAPITSDVGVSPSDVVITVAYNTGNIELRVTVVSDDWTVEGSREHIPPINNTEVNVNLPDAQIYVGSAIGIATARTVSGDITISNTGVVTIGNGKITSAMILDDTIVNADINSAAAIAYSKLNLTDSIVNADINSAAAIDISKIANLTFGTYTPTFTSISNDDGSSANGSWFYTRVGSIVTVSGQIIVDPTVGSTLTVVDFTIPIASSFTTAAQLAGNAGTGALGVNGTSGIVQSQAADDRARLTFYSIGTGPTVMGVTFQYAII